MKSAVVSPEGVEERALLDPSVVIPYFSPLTGSREPRPTLVDVARDVESGFIVTSEAAAMLLIESKVTTGILWRATVFFALVDALFVTFLVRHVDREKMSRLKRPLLVTSGLFWFAVWMSMCVFFWEPVYHYVFPAWARWFIPPAYGLLFVLVAFVIWRLALRLPGPPTLTFSFLGGLWGMITHLWGVSRGLTDKPPILQGVSTLSVAVMPVFEFMFYWCVILSIANFFSQKTQRKSAGTIERQVR